MIIVRPHRVLILSGDREIQRALKTVLEDRSPEELYVDLSEDQPLEAPAKEHASFETSSYSELGDATDPLSDRAPPPTRTTCRNEPASRVCNAEGRRAVKVETLQ